MLHVVHRVEGHGLHNDMSVDMLRFEVSDLNYVIASAARAAPLYRELGRQHGVPEGLDVLPLSCFAVTEDWPPERLAEGTNFRSYFEVPAAALLSDGFDLWPTEIWLNGKADSRNEVHYDVIVTVVDSSRWQSVLGAPADRRSFRNSVRPEFERLARLMGAPRAIPGRS